MERRRRRRLREKAAEREAEEFARDHPPPPPPPRRWWELGAQSRRPTRGMNRKHTMRRIISRWAVSLVLALVCGLSPAAAQNSDFQDLHPNAKTGIIPSACAVGRA